jgi:hypothetical protein
MRITALNDKIYLLSAPTQYEVSMAFMRFQEFYESPYKEIRGKYFSHEKYMDLYAKETGNFTYTSDWLGFNIPSHIYEKALGKFALNAWIKENELTDLVGRTAFHYKAKKYYIIGACETDSAVQTSQHEVAHALWYLYPKYKKEQKENIERLALRTRDKISTALVASGYGKLVVSDETQAYLSTSTSFYLNKKMGFPKIPDRSLNRFTETFFSFYEDLGLAQSIKEWQKEILRDE